MQTHTLNSAGTIPLQVYFPSERYRETALSQLVISEMFSRSD